MVAIFILQGLISFVKAGVERAQMYYKRVMGRPLSCLSKAYIQQHLYTGPLFRFQICSFYFGPQFRICSESYSFVQSTISLVFFSDFMCLQFTDKVASMLPKKYSQLRSASKPYCSFFFSACINFQVSMQWYFQIYSSFPYQILLLSMRSYIEKQIKTIQDNHHLI